jgi:hypothetical protein
MFVVHIPGVRYLFVLVYSFSEFSIWSSTDKGKRTVSWEQRRNNNTTQVATEYASLRLFRTFVVGQHENMIMVSWLFGGCWFLLKINILKETCLANYHNKILVHTSLGHHCAQMNQSSGLKYGSCTPIKELQDEKRLVQRQVALQSSHNEP